MFENWLQSISSSSNVQSTIYIYHDKPQHSNNKKTPDGADDVVQDLLYIIRESLPGALEFTFVRLCSRRVCKRLCVPRVRLEFQLMNFQI